MTKEEYEHIFEVDEYGRFKRLIVPAHGIIEELNLIGRDPSTFTFKEIIIAQKYAEYLFSQIE